MITDLIERIDKVLEASPIQAPASQLPSNSPPALVQHAAISKHDKEVVAACIIKEAGGEGPKGMQAVMNVISNRAKGAPGQFAGVVLRPKQFSCMNRYTEEMDPAVLQSILAHAKNHPCWAQAMSLIDQATNSNLPDLVHGATCYSRPGLDPQSWIDKLNHKMHKTVSIGRHVFYK